MQSNIKYRKNKNNGCKIFLLEKYDKIEKI